MEKESRLSSEIPDSPEAQGKRWLESQKGMFKKILGGVFSLESTSDVLMNMMGKISGVMLAALSTKLLLFPAPESPVRDPEVGKMAKWCLGTLIAFGIFTFATSVMDSMDARRTGESKLSKE